MSCLTPAFLGELGELASEASDAHFHCVVRDADNLNRTRPYRECRGLPFIVYVREDGRLYTCFSHQDDPETAVGSLLECSFAELWQSVGKTVAIQHINRHFDKNLCQANCRHHQINMWLHQMKNPPAHVNFI